MVAKTVGDFLEKISEVVDQSKTLYMHQRNQNKKLLDIYRGKLSLTTAAMVTLSQSQRACFSKTGR